MYVFYEMDILHDLDHTKQHENIHQYEFLLYEVCFEMKMKISNQNDLIIPFLLKQVIASLDNVSNERK